VDLSPAGMEPTSHSQHAANAAGMIPPFEVVRDGIAAVAVPVGMGNVPYTLCYLIEDSCGSLHVVDPGDDLDEGWALLLATLRELGKSVDDIATITVTHAHPDHLGMAGRLRSASGAPIGLHRLEVDDLRVDASEDRRERLPAQLRTWGVPAGQQQHFLGLQVPRGFGEFEPDVVLEGGSRLDVPGRNVLVRHTPGHTRGHLCLQVDDERLLLSGDHIIPTVVPGIGLGRGVMGEQISDYLESLEAIEELDAYEVLPGHGYRFRGLASRVRVIRDRHLARTQDVREVLGQAPSASVWEIASRLTWTAGWAGLPTMFKYSALAQTQMHVEFLRSGRAEPYLSPAAS
jgi:glyoxylase-like metal-dependent hydrolase (beta-lactamase superfamily II)